MFLTNAVQDASEPFRWHPTMDAWGRPERRPRIRVSLSPAIRKDAEISDVNRTGNRRFRRLWMEMEHRHGRRPAA